MKRPSAGDYATYYQGYVNRVEGDNVIEFLEKQSSDVEKILKSVPPDKESFAYAEGKWSIKELIGHFIDTERVMAYRAMSIARNEKKSLPGFEQDDYVAAADFNARTINDLLEEFIHMRKSNLVLFKSFTEEVLERRGSANNFPVTVKALIFIIAGHTEHHLKILKEKYI